MIKQTGPINPKAFIAYARAHKPFQEAYNLMTKLYAKQKRDFTGIKYISHPSTVASLLLDFAISTDAMVASLLEDALTRTTLKPETIEKLYGPKVLALVTVLGIGDSPTAATLAAHGEALREAGYEAQTVKIASLLDHVCSIPRNRLSQGLPRIEQAEALVPYLQGGNVELRGRLTAILARARA